MGNTDTAATAAADNCVCVSFHHDDDIGSCQGLERSDWKGY